MRASIPPEVGGREKYEKFLKQRIDLAEKHLSNLCSAFGGYTRKTAALRDKSDEVAVATHNFAETENVNKSLRSALENFSSTLCGIGDYRDAEVRRLEARVVAELSQYEGLCKEARELLKSTLAARDKEAARKRYSTRLRELNPRFTQQIAHAESEASKASVVVARATRTLREHTDRFEKKKLYDIRKVLLDFVTIELSFNAKAVELYTKAYNDVLGINEVEDLKDFRWALNLTEAKSTSRLGSLKKATSLNNSGFISNLFSTSSLFKRPEFFRKVNQPSGTLKDHIDNSTLKPEDSDLKEGEVDDHTSKKHLPRFQRTNRRSKERFAVRGKYCSEIGRPTRPLTKDLSTSVHQLFAKHQVSSSIESFSCRPTTSVDNDFLFDACTRAAPSSARLRESLSNFGPGKHLAVGMMSRAAPRSARLRESPSYFGPGNSTSSSGDDVEGST